MMAHQEILRIDFLENEIDLPGFLRSFGRDHSLMNFIDRKLQSHFGSQNFAFLERTDGLHERKFPP